MKSPSPILDTHEQDWLHLVLCPVWSLALGLLVGLTPLATWKLSAFGVSAPAAEAFLGAFVMAHLVIVFLRSHADPEIRKLHPVRFFVVPPVLLVVLLCSGPAVAVASAVAAWWDVYHSSLQTFGIGRIFDAKAGNDPEAGRSLDAVLSVLLYAGPILSGALLVYHARELYEFESVGWRTAGPWMWKIVSWQPKIRAILLSGGGLFVAFYLAAYARLVKRGYRPPKQKVVLHLGTAAVSIWAWGFNPLGMALFIMNFFHAWQYYALVWRYQRGVLLKPLGLKDDEKGRLKVLAAMVAAGFLYGSVFGVLGELSSPALAVTLVVSLMHFWYDGFIWSVRRNHV